MRLHLGSWAWRAGVLAAGFAVARGAAQPIEDLFPSPAAEAARDTDPAPTTADLLDRARAFYAGSPWGERLQVRVQSPTSRLRQSEVVVRCDPVSYEAGGHVRLDLGELHVSAVPGRLTAHHGQNDEIAFEAESGSAMDLIRRELPPLGVPPLVLAFDGPNGVSNPTPWTSGVRWGELLISEDRGRRLAVLPGQGNGCRLEMTLDADTGRFVRLEVEFAARGAVGDAPAPAWLVIASWPVEPGDPESWALGADGRRRVAALSDLRPRPVALAPGADLAALPLMDLRLVPWSVLEVVQPEEFASAAPGVRAPEVYCVLVVFGSGAEEEGVAERAGRAAIEAVEEAARRVRDESSRRDPGRWIRVVSRPVAVYPLVEFTRDRLARAAQRWTMAEPPIEGPPQPRDPSRLLWTVSPEATLGVLAPGEAATAVVVGPDGTLRRVVPIMGREGEITRVGEELAGVVVGAAFPDEPTGASGER